MRMNIRYRFVALAFFCAISSIACADDDLTLKYSDWKVRARPTPDSKKAGATPFDEELIFKKGILTTLYLQKQGFVPATYHSGGIDTFLKWGCDQMSSTGQKIAWEGIADRQHRGDWKMDGSIVRTLPDGASINISSRVLAKHCQS